MKRLRWELFSYSLPFKEPLSLLGYGLNNRKGLILRLYDDSFGKESDEICGEGEISPLPGLHKESYFLAEKQIRNYLSMDNRLSNNSKKSLFSSVSFGLDMAKRTLSNNLKNLIENRTLKKNKNENIKKKTMY